ncbi:glycine/D-amino acid oxidase-like deaminating enzyme [Aquamicrobium lusatiense]|uniref:Glycine/D-amino acid oxidase-like deaminating enzyme n=1 Tax=Aquamicrobium lusatiense TaxID=89772 RepID=A0A7W9S608_9HYPH|nr:FAD-binding oxidoreductase [Aquamicrobium lusatiense]MBB6014736.1 glycine/D-amino acid oxidase-like deaminating enzyme [Aquamicrobium lusatiense]
MTSAPAYNSGSGWNALLPPRIARTEAPAERGFPAIVIGAGFTGLATARRLAELRPNDQVVLIDASVMGEGASGRNSGYLLINPGEPSANAANFADDWANRQFSLARAGFEILQKQVRRYNIGCDWNDAPVAVTAAATPNVEKSARKTREQYVKWGLAPDEYDQSALHRLTGTDYYRYGLDSLTRALVQPAALHRGLADVLPDNVRLLEETTVFEIGEKAPFSIRTSRGDFSTGRVFLTNNLHARALGFGGSRMVGIYTYGAFTPELDDHDLMGLGTEADWGILPAHRMGTTLRKVGRRLLIRSGDSYEHENDPEAVRQMLHTLYRNRFPHLRNDELEFVWGGLTAVSHNGGFIFGEMRPGVFVSAGCGGAGVVRGSIHGELLAELACGEHSKLLENRLRMKGPNWLPPEPLRGFGAKIQIRFEQWQAGRER